MKKDGQKVISANDASGPVLVRRATENDIPLIIKEWKKAYSRRRFPFKYPDRWIWMFDRNPFISSSDDKLPIWISIHNGKIVGWSGSMITIIKIGDSIVNVDMGVDTYILKKYRKKGLAYKQHAFVLKKDAQPAYFAIQSRASMRSINCKLGAHPGIPFFAYYKLIGSLEPTVLYDSFLSTVEKRLGKMGVKLFKRLKKVGAHRYFSAVMSTSIKIKQKTGKKLTVSSSPELVFEKVNRFGKESDELWDHCRERFKVAICRNSQYLNWKFVDQPQLNYQRYIIYKSNNVYGIVIFRLGTPPEISVGVIAELFTVDGNIQHTLSILQFAENELVRQGADMIRCGACEPVLQRCLERSAFIRISMEIPVLRLPEKQNKINFEDLKKGLWLMSMGDHDIDVPLLNHQPGFSNIMKILSGKVQVS